MLAVCRTLWRKKNAAPLPADDMLVSD